MPRYGDVLTSRNDALQERILIDEIWRLPVIKEVLYCVV